MRYRYGIENYSERYREYGSRILKETKTSLKKAGIKVFPFDLKEEDNTEYCVVIHTKSPADDEPEKKEDSDKKTSKKTDLQWVRESLPTSNNVMSIHSKINENVSKALAEKALINKQGNSDAGQEGGYEDSYNSHDVYNAEADVSNVSTVSDASGDEGNDPLLNFFQKEIKDEGFSSSNFFGANYDIDNSSHQISKNISTYSDNMYRKKNTSVVFGGTLNVDYNPNRDGDAKERIDYNAYAFGKYKTSKITYGAGAIGTQKNGINNVTIDIGAMHNETGIYGIIKKDITFVPGLPTQSNTDINIGIGKSSGYLDFEEYNTEDKSVQEINDIDNTAEEVKNQESGIFDDVDTDDTSKYGNTIVNLVIEDTNSKKEYGIKGGYLFGYTTKNNNHAFVLPYGQISNVTEVADDGTNKEGARLIAGVNAGQKANFGNGWQISTKGLVEASRTVMTGSHPSDYILANVCFKANKNNFNSEISAGGFYTNSGTYSKYAELKVGYNVNDKFSVNLNGGYANSKFGNDNNELYQFAGGISYKF